MPLIVTGYRSAKPLETLRYDKFQTPSGRDWYNAVKRTEYGLQVLGFSSSEAWRLAWGEK